MTWAMRRANQKGLTCLKALLEDVQVAPEGR